MKSLLIFPPFWNNQYPYLSVPALKAYLTQHGHDVQQMDVNASLHNFLLSDDHLYRCLEVIGEQLRSQDSATSFKSYRELEKQYYMGKFVVQEIRNAMEVLKSANEFFAVRKNIKAKRVMSLAYNLIGLAIPSVSSMTAFDVVFNGDASYSSKKVISLVDNAEKNFLIDYYRDFVIPQILQQKPDLIGISLTGYSQLVPTLTLAKQIKKVNSAVHITVGGNAVTRLQNILPYRPELFADIDSGILYEGEGPLERLIEVLETGGELATVSNLVYTKEDKIVFNPSSPPENVNELPTPDFDGLCPQDYFGPGYSLPVFSTRGCYWNRCAFCDHSLIYGNNYRKRDVQRVVDDLQHLSAKYGVKYFHFHDECVPPSQCKALADEILRRELKVYWNLNLRIEKPFNSTLTSKMYEAGCRMVSIGVESINAKVLNLMDKGTSPAETKRVLASFSDAGILTHGFIILGFPGETRQDVQQTYDFIENNSDILHFVGPSTFSLGAMSKVATQYQDYALTKIKSDVGFDLKPDLFYLPSSGMTLNEIDEIYEKCKQLLYSNKNRGLYRLMDRTNIFFYACKLGPRRMFQLLHQIHTVSSVNGAPNSQYRFGDGVFYGKYLPSDGVSVYDYLKMKRTKTKDEYMVRLLPLIKEGYTHSQMLTELQDANYVTKNNYNPKLNATLNFLLKKELIVLNGS